MEQSYKEKYERALAKLRGLIDGIREEKCEIVEDDIIDIFPELAESEDERIRKELLTFFRESIHGGHILTNKEYDSWIAWLEKQGEKDILEDAILDGYILDDDEDGLIAETIKYKNEKQGEKHPDPYNGISFEYNGHIWGMCARDNGVDISCDKHLIKHLEKQGEQKPAEWSEEDEQRLNSCLNILQPKTFVGNTETINTKWLKSLKDRVGCEANCTTTKEWSDVDKDILSRIIDDLKFLRDTVSIDPKYAVSIIDMEREITWLNSLRPQNKWKPSDEQMEALDWQVENTSVSSWQYKATKELMEDLKKLKEGEV